MRMRYPGFSLIAVLCFLAIAASAAVAKVSLTDTPQRIYNPAETSMAATVSTALSVPGTLPLTPFLSASAECFNFDDNTVVNGGYVFIPPDPTCGAGLTHVINVGNDYIEWRAKNNLINTPQYQAGWLTFFAGTPGLLAGVNPSDPKVVYDQYLDRFIVACFQLSGSSSRWLVAISKTSDPNAGWWLHSINSTIVISGGNRLPDFTSLAVDDDAVYLCANMFNTAGTSYYGVRFWVIKKSPAYAGPNGSITFSVYDPYTLAGYFSLSTTSQVTHMWGPEPAGVGTFIVSYSGLTDGTNEYIDIIRVDNPTTSPVFTLQQLPCGDIDNTSITTFPGAPQLGGSRLIATNNRSALCGVWRNNNLYMCATLMPSSGADVGQPTAHWWRVNTTNLAALTVADQGNAGAEDLGTGTYTFFPQVEVDQCDNMAIGFAASSQSMYCGAYYASRLAGDPAGTLGGTQPLAPGTDYYIRTFTSGTTAQSRWGDYSGLSICPTDQSTFYVYNEYACTQGTPTTVGSVTEYGRWCTRIGTFMLCQPVATAFSFFDAVAQDGSVSLRAIFRSNLGVDAVNVYRGTGSGDLRAIDTVYGANGDKFVYVDKTARPGETYTYQIGVRDSDGEYLSPTATITLAGLGVALGQNSPNPFNPQTMISFTLPARELVTLTIYDASGRLVRTLVNDERDFGTNHVTWDGRNDAGQTVGSGVYFYRLTAGKFTESKKMVMLK